MGDRRTGVFLGVFLISADRRMLTHGGSERSSGPPHADAWRFRTEQWTAACSRMAVQCERVTRWNTVARPHRGGDSWSIESSTSCSTIRDRAYQSQVYTFE